MSWDFHTTTKRVAAKDHPCAAADWIINAGLNEQDVEPAHWETIQKAKGENWKIKAGTEYLEVKGKWEGDFSVYRARIDLNAICEKYDLYDHD